MSEFVTKAKMKVFKFLWKLGQIPYPVLVKILDCRILPCAWYRAERGALNWASACFCTKKVLQRCQPNSKHDGTIYGETGRYLLFVTTAIKAVKYWLRVVMVCPERHTRKAYMLVSMDNTCKETWATWIRTFLWLYGFKWLQSRMVILSYGWH